MNIFDPKTWPCGVPVVHVPFNFGGPPAEKRGHDSDSDSGQAGAIDISDSIPWHRPFFWSPTCQKEAVEAMQGVLELIGCNASGKRTRIPYAGDPEPTYVQHIFIGARNCGYDGEAEPLPLVLVPGYDAGAGFYFSVLSEVARLGFDVYGVDLLGHGLSSRPKFGGKTREEGEAFYTDAIEEWRKAQGLDKFILMGHSFGGYVAGCYALAHQERVRRLILVGSAGVEEVNASCFGPNGQPWGLEGIPLEAFKALWHSMQPQILVRMAGPLGPLMASDYVQKKFGPKSIGGLLSEKEAKVLEKYLFHCLAGGGHGMVCNPPPHHSLFFGPGVIAFAPLSQRLYALDKPISFVYGMYDWMDWREADKLRPDLRHPATLTLVEDAGHHVYLENPEGFLEGLHETLRAEMRAESMKMRPRMSMRLQQAVSGSAAMSPGGEGPRSPLDRAASAAAASASPGAIREDGGEHPERSRRSLGGDGARAVSGEEAARRASHGGPSRLIPPVPPRGEPVAVPPVRTIWGVWRPGYEYNAVNLVLDRLVEDIADELGEDDEDWSPPPGSMLAEALRANGVKDWKGRDIITKQSHFGLYD